MTSLVDQSAYPLLGQLLDSLLSRWPEHAKAVTNSFAGRDEGTLRHSERTAEMVLKLAGTVEGGLPTLVDDYRFLCEKIVLPEELYFRRNGKYRLSKFEDALSTVYNDTAFMTKYMNGLLLSDVFWVNHTRGLQHYAEVFLPSLESGARLLEIGPGHGLLLYLASQSPNVAELNAWDVSEASLRLSSHALGELGGRGDVRFERRNIFDPEILHADNADRFDAIVLSEVLEHLEQPQDALGVLHHLCKPGGRIWLNVPANSPAPDHLFLLRSSDELKAMMNEAGFDVVASADYVMNDIAMARAKLLKLTVTCVAVGRKRAGVG